MTSPSTPPRPTSSGLRGFWWRPRYWLARHLITAAMVVMPDSRYKRELNAALWTLWFRVQAHCAATEAVSRHVADDD